MFKRKFRVSPLLAIALAGSYLSLPQTFATTPTASVANVNCTTARHLVGSDFEIDDDADLRVDDADCVDWLEGLSGAPMRGDVDVFADLASGTDDDSFGRGTAENDPNPTIVTGSIPKNKSDLTSFGITTESTSAGQFLQLFWTRVQEPSGTTNMDFELNKFFCDAAATPTNCANNGKNVTPRTPVRSVGDKLIGYDLSNGGTVPSITIRTWQGSAWSGPTTISGDTAPSGPCETTQLTLCALGAVNASAIDAADSGDLGALDPFTFGEASISFTALFNGSECGGFGSVYLKSRSSDSFNSEVKDFVAPRRVDIRNCQPTLRTEANETVTVGNAISDTAILGNTSGNAGGTITFRLYNENTCTSQPVFTTQLNVAGFGSYGPVSYTPTSPGTYYWIASYSGDDNNDPVSGMCGDPGEVDRVNRAGSNISTAQTVYPQDTATITAGAGGTPSGTVSFQLFGPDNPTCDPNGAAAVYTQANVELVNVNGDMKASTTNTAYPITAASSSQYHWVASYSGDATHEPSTSNCTESFTLTIVNS